MSVSARKHSEEVTLDSTWATFKNGTRGTHSDFNCSFSTEHQSGCGLRWCSFHFVLHTPLLLLMCLSLVSVVAGASALGAHADGQVRLTLSEFCAWRFL